MHEEILEDLGLSQNEAKIYLSLLNIGLCTVTKIADKTKLHRANVYDSIKKLIQRGLVSHIQQEKITLFEATNPQALLRIVKEKEANVKSILPQLLLSKKLAQSKGEAYIIEGISSFVRLLFDLLELKKEIIAFGIPKIAPELMKTKIPHFHNERIPLKIPMKHIYNFDAPKRIEELNAMPLTYARHLDADIKSLVSTVVCGDEVLMTVWIKPVFTIRIKNQAIADSYLSHFKLLWKVAK